MPARYAVRTSLPVVVRILFAGQMYTGAGQDGGVQEIIPRQETCRNAVCALEAILRLGRLRLRGPCGAQFEFTLAAIAQNLRRLAKLVARPPPFAPLCAA